jgi:hypothetical protein
MLSLTLFDAGCSTDRAKPIGRCARRLRNEQPAAQRDDDLARQIGVSAAGVTDEQVASVIRATGSERAAFEIIAAAALGAGLLRWRQGIKALSEAADAPH